VALLTTLCSIPDVTITDAERPRTDSTEIVDNGYSVIHFKGSACPAALRGVTKIDMGGTISRCIVTLCMPGSRVRDATHCTTQPASAEPNRHR